MNVVIVPYHIRASHLALTAVHLSILYLAGKVYHNFPSRTPHNARVPNTFFMTLVRSPV